MALAAERRAELDVQISLLAEAEITKLVELVSEITERMNVPGAEEDDCQGDEAAGAAGGRTRCDRRVRRSLAIADGSQGVRGRIYQCQISR